MNIPTMALHGSLPWLLLALLLYAVIRIGRKRCAAKEAKSIFATEAEIRQITFQPFTIQIGVEDQFTASAHSIGVGPLQFENQHEPNLGTVRFDNGQQLIGKLFCRNMFSESLDDIKKKMTRQGFVPANLQEVMCWAVNNDHFLKASRLYFVAAPEGEHIESNAGRFVITQYAGVFWYKEKARMFCAHASANSRMLYLGVKPA